MSQVVLTNVSVMVCCSVRCSVLQCVALCCRIQTSEVVLINIADIVSRVSFVLLCVALCRSVLHCIAVCCIV